MKKDKCTCHVAPHAVLLITKHSIINLFAFFHDAPMVAGIGRSHPIE
jgi:hypothetical protein